MALSIARAFKQRMPANVQLDDLEQSALVGLIDGMRRDPEGVGPIHDHYLRIRIRGSILDGMRAGDWCPRRNRAREGKVANVCMVHLEDVNEQWQDVLTGAEGAEGAEDEQATIRRLDVSLAWQTPLAARDERMMRAYYERGRLLSDIATDEGISGPRVSQCITRALGVMHKHLHE